MQRRLLSAVVVLGQYATGLPGASPSVASTPRPGLVTGSTPSSSSAAAAPAVPISAGDEAVTGIGDSDGYHLYAASAGDGYTWHALATLQPAGYGDEKWIGRQCPSGDGRTIVVVVAPWGVDRAAGAEPGNGDGGAVGGDAFRDP